MVLYRFLVIVVEGVHVGKEAVLGANVCRLHLQKIIDVTGDEPVAENSVPVQPVVIQEAILKSLQQVSFKFLVH
jgi:2,3,4,5-tetrahydropyridine-2-carboxylate N-succinyltransferase